MSPEGVDQGFVMGLFCKDSFHGFFCLRGLKGSMPPAFKASCFMLRVSMLRVSCFAFHASRFMLRVSCFEFQCFRGLQVQNLLFPA